MIIKGIIGGNNRVILGRLFTSKLEEIVNRTMGTMQSSSLIYLDACMLHSEDVELIKYFFPRSRIINMIRDPMDSILSMYFEKMMEGSADSHQLDVFAAQYVEHQSRIIHLHVTYPDIVDVSYEALVFHPSKILAGLANYFGITWKGYVLDFSSPLNVALGPLSAPVFLYHGIVTTRVGYWRHFAADLRPLMSSISAQLRKNKELLTVYPSINWNLDTKFDYQNYAAIELKRLRRAVFFQAEFELAARSFSRVLHNIEMLSQADSSCSGIGLRKLTMKQEQRQLLLKRSKKNKRIVVNTKKYADLMKRLQAPRMKNAQKNILYPKNIENRQMNSVNKLLRSENEETIQVFTNCLGNDEVKLQFAHSEVLLENRKYADAKFILEGLLEKCADTASTQIRLKLCVATYKLGDADSALNIIEGVLISDVNNTSALSLKGEILISLKRYSDVIDIMSSEMSKHLHLPDELLYLLGIAHFFSKDFVNAAKVLKTLQESASGDAFYWAMMGKCEKELGHFTSAERFLQQSIKYGSNDWSVHLDLGMCCEYVYLN